jgi:hypothetical protein
VWPRWDEEIKRMESAFQWVFTVVITAFGETVGAVVDRVHGVFRKERYASLMGYFDQCGARCQELPKVL